MSDPSPAMPLEPTGAAKIGMLRPGTEVLQGRFKVLELLGRGGMGDVYLAEQVSLGRKVALKTLREDLSLQPGMTERFKREARLLSTVDHPSIVRVIDFGEAEGAYVLVMEFVEGENLASEVRKGPFDPPRALAVMKNIAEGLAAIHAQGIIHRDLKPDNVLLTTGPEGERARLLDFGIARLAEEQGAAMTQAGLVLGTPEYLSPEQATGGRIDARSDVYAFGVLAYRLLAGRHPFPGPSARDFLLQHITLAAPELAAVAPELAGQTALLALVMSCLAKDPAARPDGGKGLLTALASLEARPAAPSAPRPRAVVEAATPVELASTVASKKVPVASASEGSGRARNLAVVVLSDVKGFGGLSARVGLDEAGHSRLVLAPLKARGGHLVHRWQDRTVATFPTPTAAVQFGMAVQDGIWRHNAAAPASQPLGAAIAVHLGEVLVSGESILGEPAQVAIEAARAAAANELLLTQAVWLATNRSELVAEPRPALALPGRDELPLYRCTPAPQGAPFGGRDLVGQPDAGPTALVERGKTVALTVSQRLLRIDRGLAVGAAGVLALGGAIWLIATRDPAESKAIGFLEHGQPSQAIEVLDTSKSKGEPALRLLKAEALHQLKRHRDEAELVRAAPVEALAKLRGAELSSLIEDFGRPDRDEGLRAVLARLPASQLEQVKKLAAGSLSATQWGAVRYLDAARVPGAELVSGYLVALESSDCDTSATAATRLGELGDHQAIDALTRLKNSPRKPGVLFFSTSCGHDEAEEALEKLKQPQRPE